MYDPNVSAREFEQESGRRDGLRVVTSLRSGMVLLNELLYSRLHEDVRKTVGADSMLMPVSEMRSLLQTKTEIGLFQVAEAAATVRRLGYWPNSENVQVPWFAHIMLGESPLGDPHRQRIDDYLSKPAQARCLVLTDVLARVLPESGRAPLVLFVLFPLAVQIAAVLAFGDRPTADKLRAAQAVHLPIISSCRQCHGRVLENGETCRQCANPLWKTSWLTSTE
jgi:hypothetical protein